MGTIGGITTTAFYLTGGTVTGIRAIGGGVGGNGLS